MQGKTAVAYNNNHTEVNINTYSILEALHVRCQNRILNMRRSLDSPEHISVVCHLQKTGKTHDVEKQTFHFILCKETAEIQYHITFPSTSKTWGLFMFSLFQEENIGIIYDRE